MRISAKTKFSIIIGDPVDHSLSPIMHNTAYKKLGIDDKFIYLASNVKVENISKIVEAMRVMKNFRGLTCTIPHKTEVIKYLDWVDKVARKIGAVNSIVNDDGVLKGYNTDWLGIVIPLEKETQLAGKKVAILGAGGAARAAIYGMVKKRAKVTIFNRTKVKAEQLAREFNCQAASLHDISKIKNSDIIINCTPIGMKPFENEMPISVNCLNDKQIVFDIVYSPFETKLLKEAKKKGAKIIHGIEMLLYQGIKQFYLYTNHKAPIKTMKKVLWKTI